MKRLALTLAALCAASSALAGSDSGQISNWNQYRDVIPQIRNTGGFGPTGSDGELNVLRAGFQSGRFGVTFDDNLAARQAINTPSRQSCPQVTRTQDLRTMLVTGVTLQTNTQTLRLTREGKTGDYAVTDAWLFATKTGTIRGECTAQSASARYNLSVRQGWNVIRIYVSDKQPVSIVQNVTGQVLPWKIR